MECEHYMSERYHFGEPRQEATSSIFVLACKFALLVVSERIGTRVARIQGPAAANTPSATATKKHRHFNEMPHWAASAPQSSLECMYKHLSSYPCLPRWSESGPSTRAYQTACQGKSISLPPT